MKLAIKSAILCGTGAFLLATYAAVLQNVRPERMLPLMGALLQGDAKSYSLEVGAFSIFNEVIIISTLAAAAIGYLLGDILSKPRGQGPEKGKKGKAHAAKQSASSEPDSSSISADETFLSDLEAPVLEEDMQPVELHPKLDEAPPPEPEKEREEL